MGILIRRGRHPETPLQPTIYPQQAMSQTQTRKKRIPVKAQTAHKAVMRIMVPPRRMTGLLVRAEISYLHRQAFLVLIRV